MNARPAVGLGLDAGGTQTRWALAGADGQVFADGALAGLTALQLASEAGRAGLAQALEDLARAVASVTANAAQRVVAGFTGFGPEHSGALQAHIAAALRLQPAAVRVMTDIELACRAAFAPGEGCVVYAGTGSIAALLGQDGALQRAGGRGAVIDDAGGGHWIASQALRLVWRAEDAAPGAWQGSLLAQRLFAAIGGSDWAATRQWVYGASRGELGTLALAVAEAAHAGDADARALLQQAGRELARLGCAMLHRHGPMPLALAGRVFDLHPAIEGALRQALPAGAQAQRLSLQPHHAAARLAALQGLP